MGDETKTYTKSKFGDLARLLASGGIAGALVAVLVSYFLSTQDTLRESVKRLESDVRALQEKSRTDGAQWSVIKTQEARITESVVDTRVNQKLIEIFISRGVEGEREIYDEEARDRGVSGGMTGDGGEEKSVDKYRKEQEDKWDMIQQAK